MHILGVSGSLREASSNSRLLAAAAKLGCPDVELRITSRIARLPLFTPDVDPYDLPEVSGWADEVRSAEGIIVSTPEYAGGYPGSLKNAFDWLVGTDAWVNKPFMLLKASPRSILAQDTFQKVLETMSGVHIEAASTMIPLLGKTLDVADIVRNQQFADQIRTSILAFAAAVDSHAVGQAIR